VIFFRSIPDSIRDAYNAVVIDITPYYIRILMISPILLDSALFLYTTQDFQDLISTTNIYYHQPIYVPTAGAQAFYT
jgi:hypothetical protein